MSAERVVVARLLAALIEDAALVRAVHGVYDRRAPRASAPYIEIGEVTASDWGTKDRAGCELRIAIRHIAAARDDAVVAARIGAVVAELRGADDGCEIVSARIVRARSGYDRQDRWEQLFEIRVRCLAS